MSSRRTRSVSRRGPAPSSTTTRTGGLLKDAGPLTLPSPPFTIRARDPWDRLAQRVTRDGRWFGDDASSAGRRVRPAPRTLMAGDDFQNEYLGLSPGPGENNFRLGDRDRRRLRGPVVSLASLEGHNYGAFIFRVMPKLAARDGWLPDATVPAPSMTRLMVRSADARGRATRASRCSDRASPMRWSTRSFPPTARPTACSTIRRALSARLRERCGVPAGRTAVGPRRGWGPAVGRRARCSTRMKSWRGLRLWASRRSGRHAMPMRAQIACFRRRRSSSARRGRRFQHRLLPPQHAGRDIESEPHWMFAHEPLRPVRADYAIFEARAADTDWSRPHKPAHCKRRCAGRAASRGSGSCQSVSAVAPALRSSRTAACSADQARDMGDDAAGGPTRSCPSFRPARSAPAAPDDGDLVGAAIEQANAMACRTPEPSGRPGGRGWRAGAAGSEPPLAAAAPAQIPPSSRPIRKTPAMMTMVFQSMGSPAADFWLLGRFLGLVLL